MISNPGPGKLIVLEGLDGAGTTTQMGHMAEYFYKYHNISAWTTREPSEGPIGAQIRAALTKRLSVKKNVLVALFAADRLEHLYSKNGVIDRLTQGQWVIMDRYYLSSFAYQAMDMEHDEKVWLYKLHDYCIQPDITFFIDVPEKISLERIALNRGFHFELFETEDLLRKVRGQYLKAIKGLRKTGENIHILPGTQTVKDVEKNIRDRLKFLLEAEYLDQREEGRIWKWDFLKRIRQRAEEEIGLMYVGSKDIPAARATQPNDKGFMGGHQGIYQLVFLDEFATEYKVLAYFKKGQKTFSSINVNTKAEGHEIKPKLNEICQSEFQLRLFYNR